MPPKTVQIGVRIPQEDASFIAELQIDGATTPSDKLRAIISQARKREQGGQNYRESLVFVEEMLLPVRNRVREIEYEHQVHSELVARTLQWLSEMLAFCLASRGELMADDDGATLHQFEKEVTARVFRIIESTLQMGVTEDAPCYESDLISDQMQQALDIANVILKTRSKVQ